MDMTRQITKTLAGVLKAFLGKERVSTGDAIVSSADIFVVGYAKEFDFLWKVDCKSSLLDATFIIIAEQFPGGGASESECAERYLTPVDWAVSLSLQIEEMIHNSVLREYPKLRIFVVDQLLHKTSAPSEEFFSLFPQRIVNALPWIRLVRPGPTADGALHLGELLHVLLGTVDSSAHDTATAAYSMRDSAPSLDLSAIRRLWINELTMPAQPENRHAIANLLGPLMFSPRRLTDSRTSALRTLITRLGMSPPIDSARETFPWIDWSDPNWNRLVIGMRSDVDRPINVLLLDDLALRNGWAEFLCRAIGGKPEIPVNVNPEELLHVGRCHAYGNEINVLATESPSMFLTSVVEPSLSIDPSPVSDSDEENIVVRHLFRFRLGTEGVALDNVPDSTLDILFLDLRLFQGKGPQAEAEFLKRLLPFAERLVDDDSSVGQWCWPGFSNRQIEAVQSWITATLEAPRKTTADIRDDGVRDLRLTLLPRLLALVDPSLPIVIFSSTGRRNVIKLLEPYGNIITTFDKPRFFARTFDVVLDDAARKFNAAMYEAFVILKGRTACQRLLRECEVGRFSRGSAYDHSETGFEDTKLIEVYIDESGSIAEKKNTSDVFALGGIALFYRSESGPDRLRSLLKESQRTNVPIPMVWGIAEGFGPSDIHDAVPQAHEHQPKKINKRDYERELRRLTQMFESAGAQVVAFGVRQERSQHILPRGATSFFWEDRFDNLYREMLADVIELLAFDVIIPLVMPKADEVCSVHVDVATRTKGLAHGETREKMERDFGLRFVNFDGDWRYFSISADSVAPLINRAFANRPLQLDRLNIARACGQTLWAYEDVRYREAEMRNAAEDKRQAAENRYRRRLKNRPEQIHYVADWIARLCLDEWSDLCTEARQWFERGFRENRTSQYEQILEIGRAFDRSSAPDLLLAAYRIVLGDDVEHPASVERWLGPYVQWAMDDINGWQLIQFARLVAAD